MPKATEAQIVSGVAFPAAWNRLNIELYLFLFSHRFSEDPFWRGGSLPVVADPLPYTGGGRFEHARNIDLMLWPKTFEYQDWSTLAVQSFCDYQSTAISGCGGSSKSTAAGCYALKFYLAQPLETGVLIASTSIDGAKRRIWKNVNAYFSEFVRATGYRESTMTGNPRPSICPVLKDPATGQLKRDTAHGIHVVAVAKGEVEKAIGMLKGFHPKRLLIIGDETDSISQAIVDVCVNLQIGTYEFQTIWLGNDPSMFNPLGKLMEPEPGKPVTLGHKEWTSTSGVHCLRFDAYDSPNLRDYDKWSGIVRQKDINAAIKNYGGENSPQFWIMMRGLHPPEGADDTVLSEAALLRHGCSQNEVVWAQSFILSASLDPAFGGDRCIYRTFKRGLDTSGKMRILCDEVIPLTINAADKTNPAEYQIAAQVKSLSQARSIPPEEFIGDSTGTGRGALNVLKREWSPNINECEFGGSPSAMSVSDENPKPANEEYDRKVTELVFSIRVFVQADMIRGLDSQTAIELCQRRFFVKGKKVAIETKTEMKERGLASPDYSDAFAAYIHMLREKGVNASIVTAVKEQAHDRWDAVLRRHDIDAADDNYSPPELDYA